jgi:hypothetical protein
MATRSSLALLLLPLLLGCRSSETAVSGTVTVNDLPLERGYITFFPVEGTKAVRGAEIIDGTYHVEAMSTGRRRAVISATPEVQVAANGSSPATLKIMPTANAISPHTKGNQQVIEIRPGKQTIDLALTTR